MPSMLYSTHTILAYLLAGCCIRSFLGVAKKSVRNRRNTILVEWMAIICLLASAAVLVLQLVNYQKVRATFQSGMIVADVPVGGLAVEQASTLLSQLFSAPVELHYKDSVFSLDPAIISFRLDLETMLARADTHRTDTSFWTDFWNFLWRRSGKPVAVPLVAEYSDSQLRAFLFDIAARYDRPPTNATGDAGSLSLLEGSPGYSLDIESSMAVIDMALRVPNNRRVVLTIIEGMAPTPTLDTLRDLVLDYVSGIGFDGLVSMVVTDLETGEQVDVNPDVAYAGMSILKIPIVASTYILWDKEPFGDTAVVVEKTILQSSNINANILLMELGDGDMERGAQVLSEDVSKLGLVNTFMAGYYDQESIPPDVITPANQRTDVNTEPDPFMQTTPADIASLLTMIYQCATNGGGAFRVVFPDLITQKECQDIIKLLSNNKIATLIEAGVPEGTVVAHKHGFGNGDTIADAGIVFSLGGDYVIVIYLWRPGYLEWEASAPIMANISRVVYSYFNP